MGRIEGILEKFWDYKFYFLLIIYSTLLILLFRDGRPPSDKSMVIFGVAFILIIAMASSMRKYSLMILAFLALAFSIYLYTYSLQYPTDYLNFQNEIDSSFYFGGNDIAEFYDSNSWLIFNDKKTVLIERLTFEIDTNTTETNSTLTFSPPRSTKSYKIYVARLEQGVMGLMAKTPSVSLLSKENESVENNTFSELKLLEVTFDEGGWHEIVRRYELPRMEPYVRVKMRGNGHDSTPINLKHVYSAVYFSDMLYECIDPCMVVHSDNITTNPPYIQKINMLDEDAPKTPTTSYYVEGDNVEVIHYDIRTSRKWATAIRNLMLSIIAGLIVALVVTERRSNSN